MTLRNALAAAAVCGAGLAGSVWLGGQTPNRLSTTLARLDTTSHTFRDTTAKFHREFFTKVTGTTDAQDGILYVERKGGAVTMGARVFSPEARTLDYRGGAIRLYNPGISCFNEVSASSPGQAESFLTLGFGGSGADLQRNWQVTDLGPESLIVDQQKTQVEKLDLLPKDTGVRGSVQHVTLWVDLDKGVSVKQQLFAPTGDIQTATYSELKVNGPVDYSQFAIPKKAKACGK